MADTFKIAREALSQIPHAVAIVAAQHGEERSCGTGTCMYVSLSPARIAIAEYPGSRTMRLLQASGRFSVSLLDAGQQDLAAKAGHSAEGPDKFATLAIPVLEREGRAPAVRGSIAVLWCDVASTQPSGDHHLVIGDVIDHWVDETRSEALLRYRRRYFDIGRATSDEAPEGYPT